MNSSWLQVAEKQGLAALERAANRVLALDSAGASGLHDINGSIFDFTCIAPYTTYRLRLCIRDGALSITRRNELGAGETSESSTASLQGPVKAYLQLLAAEDPAVELINGPLIVGGDSRAIEKLWHALSRLEPDWEQPLAEVIGDIPAHRIGRALRRLWRDGSGLRAELPGQLRHFVRQSSNSRPITPKSAFTEFALLRQSAEKTIAAWIGQVSSSQPGDGGMRGAEE